MSDLAFADDCTVAFDAFLVSWDGRYVEGPSGEAVAELPGAVAMDLAAPGPHLLGEDPSARVGDWEHLHAILRPSAELADGNAGAAGLAALRDGGLRLLVEGALTCGADVATFSWDFDRSIKHHCYAPVPIAEGEVTATAYTIAAERLFQPALQAFGTAPVGRPFLDADADGDGAVTPAELDAIPLAALGWPTATWRGVDTLWEFVEVQTFYLVRTEGEDCTPELLAAE